MPRDYKNNRSKKPAEGNSNAYLLFFAGLLAGLIMAIVVYLQINKPSEQAPLISDKEIVTLDTEEKKIALTKLSEKENLPEPTFDFYKILPDMEVNVSEWDETESPITADLQSTQRTGVYVLQVGSFRKLQAADTVKAKLALLGIDADIQRVVINGQDVFHRVRIGPYKTPQKLEEAQSRLMANDLQFKLLKLTVSDQ